MKRIQDYPARAIMFQDITKAVVATSNYSTL